MLLLSKITLYNKYNLIIYRTILPSSLQTSRTKSTRTEAPTSSPNLAYHVYITTRHREGTRTRKTRCSGLYPLKAARERDRDSRARIRYNLPAPRRIPDKSISASSIFFSLRRRRDNDDSAFTDAAAEAAATAPAACCSPSLPLFLHHLASHRPGRGER